MEQISKWENTFEPSTLSVNLISEDNEPIQKATFRKNICRKNILLTQQQLTNRTDGKSTSFWSYQEYKIQPTITKVSKIPLKQKPEILPEVKPPVGQDIDFNFIKPIKAKLSRQIAKNEQKSTQICKIPQMMSQRQQIINEIKQVENKLIEKKPVKTMNFPVKVKQPYQSANNFFTRKMDEIIKIDKSKDLFKDPVYRNFIQSVKTERSYQSRKDEMKEKVLSIKSKVRGSLKESPENNNSSNIQEKIWKMRDSKQQERLSQKHLYQTFLKSKPQTLSPIKSTFKKSKITNVFDSNFYKTQVVSKIKKQISDQELLIKQKKQSMLNLINQKVIPSVYHQKSNNNCLKSISTNTKHIDELLQQQKNQMPVPEPLPEYKYIPNNQYTDLSDHIRSIDVKVEDTSYQPINNENQILLVAKSIRSYLSTPEEKSMEPSFRENCHIEKVKIQKQKPKKTEKVLPMKKKQIPFKNQFSEESRLHFIQSKRQSKSSQNSKNHSLRMISRTKNISQNKSYLNCDSLYEADQSILVSKKSTVYVKLSQEQQLINELIEITDQKAQTQSLLKKKKFDDVRGIKYKIQSHQHRVFKKNADISLQASIYSEDSAGRRTDLNIKNALQCESILSKQAAKNAISCQENMQTPEKQGSTLEKKESPSPKKSASPNEILKQINEDSLFPNIESTIDIFDQGDSFYNPLISIDVTKKIKPQFMQLKNNNFEVHMPLDQMNHNFSYTSNSGFKIKEQERIDFSKSQIHFKKKEHVPLVYNSNSQASISSKDSEKMLQNKYTEYQLYKKKRI